MLYKDTKIQLYDGYSKKAGDLKKGDMLMGFDSNPIKIIAIKKENFDIYEVIPKRGEPWICNLDHFLCLVRSGSSEVLKISLRDYLNSSNYFKSNHMLYKSGVEFENNSELPVDPWFVGCWLGDGRKSLKSCVSVSNPDNEVIEGLKKSANNIGVNCVISDIPNTPCKEIYLTTANGKKNPLLDRMRELFPASICIPKKYKTSTRENRLELLAGLLDTDGHQIRNCFEIVQKFEELADDILYLARSLGFYASMSIKKVDHKNYKRVNISGHTDEIPTKVERKQATKRKQRKQVGRSSFSVEQKGKGECVEIICDSDEYIFLNDFTVTSAN